MMKMMIFRFLYMVVVLLFITLSSVAKDKGPKVDKKFPKIKEVHGQVYDLSQAGSARIQKTKRILEAFHAKTDRDSSLTLEIYPDLTVTLGENSELHIPAISWESRQASELRLVQGRMDIQATKTQESLKVKSELFESMLPWGDYSFVMDRDSGKASLVVIQGQLSFSPLNSDEVVQVQSGQKATFIGEKENQEFQYDLLLKGKKVPKGQLLPVEKLTAEEIKSFSRAARKKRELAKKILTEKKEALEESFKQDQICHAPRGKLNQCVWRQEGNQCIRRRCTADGLWKDPQEVGRSQCQNRVKAQLCDY